MQADMWGRCWAAHSIALMTGGSQSCLLSMQDSTKLAGSHHLLRNVVAAWATAARALRSMLRILLILKLIGVDLGRAEVLMLSLISIQIGQVMCPSLQ